MGTFKTIISIIAGGILFAWIFDDAEGLFVGMALGFLLARSSVQKNLLKRMEKRLKEHEALLRPLEKNSEELAVVPAQSSAKEQSAVHQKAEAAKPEEIFVPTEEKQNEQGQSRLEPDKSVRTPSFIPPSIPSSVPPTADPFERMLAYLWNFFTQGNVVLRVGLLVLFFGVSFLLKYAADRSMLPIELRLLAVALAGIAMLLFGWRLRLKRSGFALLMQGGGIGLLFLDVFAAFKLYHLLPAPLAFTVMVGLVCTSAALALLQDAKSLALFGATGGFLAPVLLSTGSGNHVALFSYYALLNTGILIIAWFKAWRGLNLLGFFFTLGIGSFWGVSSYEPRYFASTEPFLTLFFLMFTLIGVLFAFRQPPKLRGYVDSSLVFGTPIICFSLQAALVKDMKYGLAISALLVSLFYIGLARFLWNKGDERLRQGMRTLTEAFLALGIVFVTLAVPLALSGRWTAVTWALEGAALIWVGVRQNRLLPRNFGTLLQFIAAFFFLTSGFFSGERMILFNGMYLGCLIISLSSLFSSWYLYRAENLRGFERYHHLLLFIWGVIWWFGGGINELNYQLVPYYTHQNYGVLLFIGLSCAAMITLARRISWPIAAWPSLGFLPMMVLVSLDTFGWQGFFRSSHFFAHLGWLAWPVFFLLLHHCLYLGRPGGHAGGRMSEKDLPAVLLRLTHIGAYLLLVLILTAEAAWQVHHLTGGVGVWNLIVWGLVPAALLQLVQSKRLARYWPLSDYAAQYQEESSAVLAVLLWLWLLMGSLLSSGNAAPLPFIPIFNPLELSQLIVFLIIFRWLLLRRDYVGSRIPFQAFIATGGATIFFWFNTALARSVHHFAAVPFDKGAMLDSRLYQAALAILWGTLALILMVTAHRLKHRTLWLVGAGLVGITVGKLFLVDLANSGTVERIVSFLAVGALLMIIGYFAPLPPALAEQEEAS
ncbi:Putative membrane protein [Candidatus Electrothrix laxa]